MANSAGSNPATRTNATVVQPAGGNGFKPRAVSVRIGPVAPTWLAWRSVRGEHQGRISPTGCNPVGYEIRGAGAERFKSSTTHQYGP